MTTPISGALGRKTWPGAGVWRPLPTHSRRHPAGELHCNMPLRPYKIACESTSSVTKKRQYTRKSKVPPLPQAQGHQQTVYRSFTLGGIGLHTGEYAFVRVRPAVAGEGRYFVRVPPGTNAANYQVQKPQYINQASNAEEEDGLDEVERANLFMRFLEAEDEGYSGTFGEFVSQETGEAVGGFLNEEASEAVQEEPLVRDDSEDWVPAEVNAAETYRGVCTALRGPNVTVLSPEAMLSALESCGVDNARIEIEGGEEVPVVDGSALGWALEIQKAGLVEASAGGRVGGRTAPAPQEMLTVRDGESFISFYPGPHARVTAGVDHAAEAAAIGRQWFTWAPGDSSARDNFDKHYRWEVAPARTVLPSIAAVEQLLEAGLLQAGPENCCLVADGQDWLDPMMLRFPGYGNETARAAVMALMGNLALTAAPGGRGLPAGHVVAYRASPELQLTFAAALQAKAAEWEHQPVSV